MSPNGSQRWTLLTNHAHVLTCLAEDPDIRLRELAVRVGVTERAAHRIVADLEEAGFVTHERVGRRNRYRVDLARRSVHPGERHLGAAQLVEMAMEPR